MIGSYAIREKDTDAQPEEQHAVDEQPELRATVELETQAKIDTDHPDVTRASLTLEQEERLAAREAEIARTRRRVDRRQDSTRAARTRRAAAEGSAARRRAFQRRAASVDPWAGPETGDPRERLDQETVAAVNQQAARIRDEVPEPSSRAAIARQLAERVADGDGLVSATVRVSEREETAPGTVVPVAALETVRRSEVSIDGRVTTLWDASHPAISWVGLLEDDTGRVKVTCWKRSAQRPVTCGQRVRIRAGALNWYQGRPSVAVTGDSQVIILDA